MEKTSFRQKSITKSAYFSDLSFHGVKTLGFWMICAIFAVFLFFMVGCSRQHYRIKADNEVYSLLTTGGTHDPRWKLDDYRINTDKRSRMFDPNPPDCEPMPPDDPTAHGKMHLVNGKKGSKHWHDKGNTLETENPCWQQYLLFNEKGAVPMDKDGAVELALLHSPEYQSAMENLYLAAMKVSRERFRFDVQFYGGDSLFYTANGRVRDGNTTLVNDANVRAEMLFATGGELVVGLANSITWSFSGPDTWRSTSLFNAGFVQPILRNAGKKIILEDLTQSERDFLAAIRQMVFFQQGYYTKIVTGSGQQAAPGSTRAGSTPSYGNGFYGLLAEQIRIQNQRQNIIALEDNLQRFSEVFDAGQLTDVSQVEETRQRLLNSESSLLQRIVTYQGNTDTYLRSLGLPPDLKVDISDSLMEQFQLTSPTLTDLQEDLGKLLAFVRTKEKPLPEDFGENLEDIIKRTESEIKSLDNDLEVLRKSIPDRVESLNNLKMNLEEQIRQGERIDPSVYDPEIFKERVETLQNKTVPENIQRLHAAFTLLELIIRLDEPALRKMIRGKSFEQNIQDALKILKLNETAQLDSNNSLLQSQQELEETQKTFEALKDSVKKQEEIIWKDNPLVPRVARRSAESGRDSSVLSQLESETAKAQVRREEAHRVVEELRQKDDYRDWIRRVLSAFQYELVSLSLMQTRARLDAITLVPTSINAEEAFKIAEGNRLDWMNRRASLVDSWRQIDLAANQLKGNLNVTVDGEIGTIDKRGVRFDGDNGQLRIGLKWDSPLTRHNEMLDYRRTQLEYQAARRDYYTYVDSVNADLRRILRDSRLQQIDFEIARNAVRIATIRVDVWQLKMEQPPARNQKIDTNTATQLISALDGLMTSQNDFLNTWVNYQTQRMLLDLNMGTMELDVQGRWVDPGVIAKDRQGAASKYAAVQKLTPKQRLHQNRQNHPQQRKIPVPAIPSAPKLAPVEKETVTETEESKSEAEPKEKRMTVARMSQPKRIPKTEDDPIEEQTELKTAPLPPTP